MQRSNILNDLRAGPRTYYTGIGTIELYYKGIFCLLCLLAMRVGSSKLEGESDMCHTLGVLFAKRRQSLFNKYVGIMY